MDSEANRSQLTAQLSDFLDNTIAQLQSRRAELLADIASRTLNSDQKNEINRIADEADRSHEAAETCQSQLLDAEQKLDECLTREASWLQHGKFDSSLAEKRVRRLVDCLRVDWREEEAPADISCASPADEADDDVNDGLEAYYAEFDAPEALGDKGGSGLEDALPEASAMPLCENSENFRGRGGGPGRFGLRRPWNRGGGGGGGRMRGSALRRRPFGPPRGGGIQPLIPVGSERSDSGSHSTADDDSPTVEPLIAALEMDDSPLRGQKSHRGGDASRGGMPRRRGYMRPRGTRGRGGGNEFSVENPSYGVFDFNSGRGQRGQRSASARRGAAPGPRRGSREAPSTDHHPDAAAAEGSSDSTEDSDESSPSQSETPISNSSSSVFNSLPFASKFSFGLRGSPVSLAHVGGRFYSVEMPLRQILVYDSEGQFFGVCRITGCPGPVTPFRIRTCRLRRQLIVVDRSNCQVLLANLGGDLDVGVGAKFDNSFQLSPPEDALSTGKLLIICSPTAGIYIASLAPETPGASLAFYTNSYLGLLSPVRMAMDAHNFQTLVVVDQRSEGLCHEYRLCAFKLASQPGANSSNNSSSTDNAASLTAFGPRRLVPSRVVPSVETCGLDGTLLMSIQSQSVTKICQLEWGTFHRLKCISVTARGLVWKLCPMETAAASAAAADEESDCLALSCNVGRVFVSKINCFV